MKVMNFAPALVVVAATAIGGCGGQVTSGGGEPAGSAPPAADDFESDFLLCPTRAPAAGAPCTDEGNQCEYYATRACEAAFRCTNGRWAAYACAR